MFVCCSQEANFTSGSFRARDTPSLNIMELLRATLVKPVATQEAADTCASAAQPPAPETRQAGDYIVTERDAKAGQWQLIRNTDGECGQWCSVRVL